MLKLHKEFRFVYNKAKSFHSSSVVLFYLPAKETRKVGFTATKKIGNAVRRNKAKRRLRALFLLYRKQLQNGTYVFVAKEGIDTISFERLKKDFYANLRRARVLV